MGHDGLLRIITESGNEDWFKESQPGVADMEQVSESIYLFLEDMANLYSETLTLESGPEITEEQILRAAQEYAKRNFLRKNLPHLERAKREINEAGIKIPKRYKQITTAIMLVVEPRNKSIEYTEYAMRFLNDKIDAYIGRLARYGYSIKPVVEEIEPDKSSTIGRLFSIVRK